MNRDDRSVRDVLRAHDPAEGDEGLPPVERARIRRIVLDAVQHSRNRPALIPRAAGVALGITALALVLSIFVFLKNGVVPPHPVPGTTGIVRPSGPPAETPPARQIQMTTPGGTRIVWVLKGDFDL